MSLDLTPWFIGGGAEHSPEVARALAYVATRGSEGIAGVTDLRVEAQPIPDNTVRVIPGGGHMLNRYPGNPGQSYTLRNSSATAVPIPPTGSSGGRTDLVIARVLDPQYEGVAPADPTTFEYARLTTITGVSSSVKSAKELNLGYPAIALARITIPANTATITSSMITDLRRVALPRRERAMVTIFPDTNLVIPTSGYNYWPITAAQRPLIFVPEWATRVDIHANVTGIKFDKGSTVADTVAGVRTGFGPTAPAQNGIMVQDAEDTGGRYNNNWIGTHLITEAMRGTDQYLAIQATRSSGTGLWTADYQTSIMIDFEFSEGAQ